MKQRLTRRTTLTLPAACLDEAERIARERHVNLSSVISDALTRGLREDEQARRSSAVWQTYSKAFSGFSEDELAVLDGIMMEAPAQGRKALKARS